MTLISLVARGAAVSASAPKWACSFTVLAYGSRLAPRITATLLVQPRLLSTPFSSCAPLLVTRKPLKKITATAAKAKKSVAKPRATAGSTKRKKRTATKVGAARKSLKTKSRVSDRKLKIRRLTAVQRAKAQAKLARARASAKAKVLKAREAAKKEKIRAEIRTSQELVRSCPKRLSAVSIFFAKNISSSGGSNKDAFKTAWVKWNSLSEAAKEVYIKKGAANSARFQSDIKQWYSGLSSEQKAVVNSRTFQKKLAGYQARAVRNMRPRPLNPYARFFKDMFTELSAKLKRDQPGLKGNELPVATCKLAASKWKLMSSEEKKMYAA